MVGDEGVTFFIFISISVDCWIEAAYPGKNKKQGTA